MYTFCVYPRVRVYPYTCALNTIRRTIRGRRDERAPQSICNHDRGSKRNDHDTKLGPINYIGRAFLFVSPGGHPPIFMFDYFFFKYSIFLSSPFISSMVANTSGNREMGVFREGLENSESNL